MKRRDFLKCVLAGGIATPSLARCAFPMVRSSESEDDEAAQTSGKRPNIIVIMADDMGFSPSIMPGLADTFCSYGPLWANVSHTPFKQNKGTNYEGGISTPLSAF